MKKRKWFKRFIVIILLLALIGGGATAGIKYLKTNSGSAVEVYNVSDINAIDWISFGDMEGASGTVVSDVSQSVYLPDDKVINEVYVEEGDSVKIGDKLLSYDTTLLELDQELQELIVMELELEIKSAEADLQKLKNTTPVAKSSRDDDDDFYYDLNDTFDSDWDWDSDDDEARLISGERAMMAVHDGTEETEIITEQITTENVIAEPVQEQQSETQMTQDELPQEESESESEKETQPETEQILGEESEGIVENLTPEDLNNAVSAGSGEGSSIEDIMSEMETEAPQLYQSLQPFLNNIRIKERNAEGSEILLLDTIQYEEGSEMTANITNDRVNIIPHFIEKEENRFEKRNTYMMYIKGIQLKKDVAGKIYGTAVIDGNDYPEIGGFTCVPAPESKADDVVKLILAFHDGLDQQHENGAALADMYLELHLSTEELSGDSLIFRTSDKEEEDRVIYLTKPEVTEPETELIESEDILMDDTQMDSVDQSEFEETDSENETENESESESEEPVSEEEIEGESDIEIESETETETEGTASEPISEFLVSVDWYHGTNDRSRWPEEMSLLFYEYEEDLEPVFVEKISDGYEEDGGSGEEDGDEEPETESESVETGAMPGEIPGVMDESETAGNEMSEVIEDPDDPYDVTYQVWRNVVVTWPAERLNPDQYYMSVYVPNYIPRITWDGATKTYTIEMKYLEPEESPLLKLEPLAELSFVSGAEGMYYKGSGTAEDPFIFFCTDGAVIKSSFVNWVLGFDELGTTRISDGYYVRLEIRESDSITGAFIRSVGLDGTIRVEYGYDPGVYWIFTSDSGIVKYQEEVADDSMLPDFPDMNMNPDWDDIGESYTAEELAYAIAEKEREIRQLRVDEKKANLELKQFNRELEESVVLSSVNGVIQSLGGSEESDAFMVVASESGMYVRSTVSEMDLDKVKKGQVVNCTSWETGSMFSATITQVDYFPTSTSNSDYYWSGGNVNSSSYPILAVVDNPEMVSEYESVSVQLPVEAVAGGSGVYLEKAYIRSENGQSYVYIADEKGLLKKQFIRTGGNSYGYIEIKAGLSDEDKIAFPYGKNVKPGAKTIDAYDDYY